MLRFAGLVLLLSACASNTPGPSTTPTFDGRWRVVFDSAIGPLPVILQVRGDRAWFDNGADRGEASAVVIDGDTLRLEFDWYESALVATRDGDRLVGTWSKRAGQEWERLDIVASRHEGPRFDPLPPDRGAADTVDDITGEWAATIDVGGATFDAYGAFRAVDGEIHGILFTPYGESRMLIGDFERGVLRLVRFEGSHVGTLMMTAREDGTLEGELWRSDGLDLTMTMKRSAAPTPPDPYAIATLTNDDGRLEFAFPDRDGNVVRSDDPRFSDKVVIVDIFGTWCPNCWEQAELLAEWQRRYGERGLVVVGIAFEETEDEARAWKQIERFAAHAKTDYPMLLASANGGGDAADALSDIDNVVSFPTTVFIGRDGRVRRIHSGFLGPGRPKLYEEQVKEQEALIERLLAE